jgi:hypothetical protein
MGGKTEIGFSKVVWSCYPRVFRELRKEILFLLAI